MPALQPGTHVGPTTILRVLGIGSIAIVYEVLHDRARRALKVVEGGLPSPSSSASSASLSPAASSQLSARLAQEGEAIAMIEHVNVVRWYASGVDGERVWILLELVEGRNLREILISCRASNGRLPLERAVRIVRHACEGLAAVHAKRIIHRDMTPENILVTADDDLAKVADFGSAKLSHWGVKTTNAKRLTSALYMAPELCRGAAPGPGCDVYAMGSILYEAIAGVHPVVPLNADQKTTYDRHLHYEPPPLALVENVPSDLSDLVQRAIAKDPARRCTMRELSDGLAGVLDRLLVWRRSAARSVPLPNQDPAFASTIQMPVYPMSAPASVLVSAEPTGPRGTIPMAAPAPSAAVGGPAEPLGARVEPPAFEPRAERSTGDLHADDRDAAPPPAPSCIPPTLKTPSRPPPAAPPPALNAVPEPEGAHRSTASPVESTARRSITTPRRRAVHAIVAGGAILALAAVSWWTLSESEPRPAPRPASPPAASVSATPSASIARPPPPSSATPRRAPTAPIAPRR